MLSNICLKYETYVISFWFIMQILVHWLNAAKLLWGRLILSKNCRYWWTFKPVTLNLCCWALCALVRTVNTKQPWVLTAFTLGQQPKQDVTQINFSQVAHVQLHSVKCFSSSLFICAQQEGHGLHKCSSPLLSRNHHYIIAQSDLFTKMI